MKGRQADCHPDRKHLAKGFCKPCYDSNYSAKNRERLNAKASDWAKKNPERRRAHKRKYHYGITTERFNYLLAKQSGLCAICRNVMDSPHVDHDHKTGKVRGLLCGSCNRALGLLKEDPELFKRAIWYLDFFNEPRAIQVVNEMYSNSPQEKQCSTSQATETSSVSATTSNQEPSATLELSDSTSATTSNS